MNDVFIPKIPAFSELITHCTVTLELYGYKHWIADREKIQIETYRNRTIWKKYGDWSFSGAELRFSAADALEEAVNDWIERQGLNR